MLNLTFLFDTCGKTEIQFIQIREDKFNLNPTSLHTRAVWSIL